MENVKCRETAYKSGLSFFEEGRPQVVFDAIEGAKLQVQKNFGSTPEGTIKSDRNATPTSAPPRCICSSTDSASAKIRGKVFMVLSFFFFRNQVFGC